MYDGGRFTTTFLLVNAFLLLRLLLSFSCLDYILFYVCFESRLIPTIILILGWGYQPERLQAGVYILFYTLFGSLPLLVSLLGLYGVGGSAGYGLSRVSRKVGVLNIWYVCRILAFLVKLPIFGVHLWLPKAHVEAPVAGSIVLAGVLLKLGGYGLIRICPVFMNEVMCYSWVWVSLGLAGGAWVSILCIQEGDVKSLIAYSSVAHMGIVLCGLIICSRWGVCGALALIVGHGLCSSGLFCLANMGYERIGRRSLLISKGLLNLMPSLALW